MRRSSKHTGNNKPKRKKFLKKPRYPGGSKALERFLLQNLRYPEEARRHGIEGNVQVAYEVDENGKVVSAKVLRGIGYGCDEEALRLVKLLRYEGVRNRHVHVRTRFTLVIRFRLPRAPKLQYQYVPSSTSRSPAEQTYFTYTVAVKS